MTSDRLALAYLVKARARLKILGLLLADGDFSDVVREAQEAVELATKAMLLRRGRSCGTAASCDDLAGASEGAGALLLRRR